MKSDSDSSLDNLHNFVISDSEPERLERLAQAQPRKQKTVVGQSNRQPIPANPSKPDLPNVTHQPPRSHSFVRTQELDSDDQTSTKPGGGCGQPIDRPPPTPTAAQPPGSSSSASSDLIILPHPLPSRTNGKRACPSSAEKRGRAGRRSVSGPAAVDEGVNKEEVGVETDGSLDSRKSSLSRFMSRRAPKAERAQVRSGSEKPASVRLSSRSSASVSADESIDIAYQTLTRMKSCPGCANAWTTYKAPRSKLSHIRKCAHNQDISAKDLAARVERLIKRQAQAEELGSDSLLERHLRKKHVEVNIVVDGSDSYSVQAQAREQQILEGLPSNPEAAKDRRTNASNSLVRPNPSHLNNKLHASTGGPTAGPSSTAIRNPSSILAQARSRSETRNSAIATRGQATYSLWDVAGGDDQFDFQRSVIAAKED
ncbi:hypothetical protein CROQUDRAFT_307728 [Cronartium quercuum f. sp. fusiforme G11]|uniref:Uncharacterized protein n=1 Tax=Cronartium quercuum f. sp. fusiforme G11 TaxID=708437 RepID=A0A9P6N8T7_9BASI|nr:hypothetical protein CROQUDRAFT_307728 [Cronartium quercuum f. sp. fusiforme G11]